MLNKNVAEFPKKSCEFSNQKLPIFKASFSFSCYQGKLLQGKLLSRRVVTRRVVVKASCDKASLNKASCYKAS